MSNDEEIKTLKLNKRKNIYMILQNIDKVFLSLNNVYNKIKDRDNTKKISKSNIIFEKLSKMWLFIVTLLIIFGCYYFYIYVNYIKFLY